MTLNHMELQNLRHLIGSHQIMQKKFDFYASEVQYPEMLSCLSRKNSWAK
jgi:hypothetical protein